MDKFKNMHNGIAIAIAWPETLCKQAGAWYDLPLKWIGLNKRNYYKVGHAAVVLIESNTGECHYFDFGRYHSPYQHGRVRSVFTDHDLDIDIKAEIRNGKIINYYEILFSLFKNDSCHGMGALHASYCEINFEDSFTKASDLQKSSPIKYGPFEPSGTNCSRFVNTVLLAGSPKWINKFLLYFPKTLSPTPIGNVKALGSSSYFSIKYDSPINQFVESTKNNMNHETSASLS